MNTEIARWMFISLAVGLVTYGTALIYMPAAFIVWGLCAGAVALLLTD